MTHVQPALDLTLTGAQAVLDAAIAQAGKIGMAFCITVSDRSGAPILAARMDGAARMAAAISADKAATVTGFGGMPTSRWWAAIENDNSLVHGITHTPGLVIFGGGVGIFLDGALVGAVGVSGGSPEQDEQVASAGATVVVS